MTNGRIITALAVAIALCGLVATTAAATAATTAAAAAARPGQPIANSHMNVAARRAVEDGAGEDSNSATATTTADEIVEFAWDNSIGHNDFYGEMDAEFGLFGATVGAKFVVQMGKMLAFAEVSLWDVFDASILIDLKVPNMMNLKTYTEGPDFSAKVQGFVSAPGLTVVQDLVVAKMIEAAKGAEQAFNVAADTFATEKEVYEKITLPKIQGEIVKWKLKKSEKDIAKVWKDQAIDDAIKAVQDVQTHINYAYEDYNKLADDRTAFISGVCDGMDTNTEFSKGSTDGCIKKVANAACKIDTCEMPNSCPDVARSCNVRSPCVLGETPVWECFAGFFTHTVTSLVNCGADVITNTAECGWKFTAKGAECGWTTVRDATLCATSATTQCFDTFAGDVGEFFTNPAVFCNALNDGTSELDRSISNALQTVSDDLFDLATAEETVAQLKAQGNDIIDSYGEFVNQMNEDFQNAFTLPTHVLTAAEESAKGLASAAAAAQKIIAEVADDFDISKIFINVTLSTETAVPSDITLNIFGAELVVPGFSLDFKAAIDQGLEPLDALVDDLAAKAAEAAEQLFTETIPGWVETAAAGIDSVVVGPVQQEIEKLKAELEASLGAERYSEGLQVSAGASFCQVDANNCVSDGTGDHGDNEACTINVLGAGTLTATDFNTETGYDYVTIGGTRYSGSTGPSNVAVAAGSTFTWRSDSSITRAGFTICWTPDAPLPFV